MGLSSVLGHVGVYKGHNIITDGGAENGGHLSLTANFGFAFFCA
jgi:hypothetical protein